MKLAEWRNRQNKTQEEVGNALGVGALSVHRYETGKRVPGPAMMIEIYVLTGGDVEPNDFHNLPELTTLADAA